jgi:hypothetical protein
MAMMTKTFDAVEESRRWREATSRKLDAMSQAEILAHFQEVREKILAERAARQPGAPR